MHQVVLMIVRSMVALLLHNQRFEAVVLYQVMLIIVRSMVVLLLYNQVLRLLSCTR